jgi:hypothetical protein
MGRERRPPLIYVDGEPFDASSEHFSFHYSHKIGDMKELSKLSAFTNLKSASLCGSGLDDVGLIYVSQVTTLENLDLQDTRISNQGLRVLESLPRLRILRLKGNPQLSNDGVPHLLRLKSLVDLQVHETSIDQYGLKQLAVMDNLRDICVEVWNNNYSFEMLLELSSRMPQCRILAKGRGEFYQGEFRGTWAS